MEKHSPRIQIYSLKSICNLPLKLMSSFQLFFKFSLILPPSWLLLESSVASSVISLVTCTVDKQPPLLFRHPVSLFTFPPTPFYTGNQKDHFKPDCYFFYTGRSSITSFSGFPLSTGKYSHPTAHWIALRTFYDFSSPHLPSFVTFPLSLPIYSTGMGNSKFTVVSMQTTKFILVYSCPPLYIPEPLKWTP